jgi:hypothetical protein
MIKIYNRCDRLVEGIFSKIPVITPGQICIAHAAHTVTHVLQPNIHALGHQYRHFLGRHIFDGMFLRVYIGQTMFNANPMVDFQQ